MGGSPTASEYSSSWSISLTRAATSLTARRTRIFSSTFLYARRQASIPAFLAESSARTTRFFSPRFSSLRRRPSSTSPPGDRRPTFLPRVVALLVPLAHPSVPFLQLVEVGFVGSAWATNWLLLCLLSARSTCLRNMHSSACRHGGWSRVLRLRASSFVSW